LEKNILNYLRAFERTNPGNARCTADATIDATIDLRRSGRANEAAITNAWVNSICPLVISPKIPPAEITTKPTIAQKMHRIAVSQGLSFLRITV